MANSKELRIYTGKDVDMLTAASTIIENAIAEKDFLISKRATWADPFLGDIKTRINNAFFNYFGMDNAREMREATRVVLNLQAEILPKLAEFKVQIDSDFKNPRRTEILNQLGFTAHLKNVQKKDQEALIELLFKFSLNLTPPLNAEITANGTAQSLILDIKNSAQVLKDSNINQEAFKTNRPNISAAAVKELNEIYEQVIAIAKIARKFLSANKTKADQFSYAKIIKALNAPPRTNQPTPPPTS